MKGFFPSPSQNGSVKYCLLFFVLIAHLVSLLKVRWFFGRQAGRQILRNFCWTLAIIKHKGFRIQFWLSSPFSLIRYPHRDAQHRRMRPFFIVTSVWVHEQDCESQVVVWGWRPTQQLSRWSSDQADERVDASARKYPTLLPAVGSLAREGLTSEKITVCASSLRVEGRKKGRRAFRSPFV